MSHAAQCLICKHQHDRRGVVVGCLRLEGNANTDLAIIVGQMLYRAARREPCVAFERLPFGPDAYRSIDLPEKP